MPSSVTPFLMFTGNAETAMTLYLSAFPGSAITRIERYRAGESGAEGTVKQARFRICGQDVMCIDSPAVHAFTFTPAVSFFVECVSREEQQAAFDRLSAGGQVLMPLDNYGFSTRFVWLNDRFGVSWQLNLA